MKMNLLLIEDAAINLLMLESIFKDDFIITTAKSCKQAQKYIEDPNYLFDVIILDFITPGAVDLLHQIKKNERLEFVPVIVITAGHDHNEQIQAFNNGAYDYITKPFSKEILLKRIINAGLYSHRYRQIMAERDILMSRENVDTITKVFNLDAAKWLVNEKIHDSPNEKKALLVFTIDNLLKVYQEEGKGQGDYTIQKVAELICSHFSSVDIVGRINKNTIIVFMNHLLDEDTARSKANEIVRLFHQKQLAEIPDDISLTIAVATSCENTTYEQLFEQAISTIQTSED